MLFRGVIMYVMYSIPIRYPAGFVYIYSVFYLLTGQGHELRVAQYIFAFIYLLNLALVIRICHKTKVHCVRYIRVFQFLMISDNSDLRVMYVCASVWGGGGLVNHT